MIKISPNSISVNLFISFLSLTSALNIDYYGKCTMPNLQRGMCIPLRQCAYMNKILEKLPISDADRILLQNSQCGYRNKSVNVCCSEQKIEEIAINRPNIRTRIDVSETENCGVMFADKIFGGVETKMNEFPWMALIEYNQNNRPLGHLCGGSLINERYVLTAAHCIAMKDLAAVSVRLGEWKTDTNPDCVKDIRGYDSCADPHQDIQIEKIIVHEKYVATSKNHYHDIALLRLSRPVIYTDYITPICLPLADHLKQSDFVGQSMDVAGWGRTPYNKTSNIKLKATVPIVPLNECKNTFKKFNVDLSSSQMCAGGMDGIDSCNGDSGGPLMAVDSSDESEGYYFIAGIVSFGSHRCGTGLPGAYTRVGDYVDWIKENTKP